MITVFLILPLIIAAFVFGGVFLGYYLTELLNAPSPILYPLLFSAIGLGLSILVSFIIAAHLTKKK